jgi:hypothetical protein
MNEVTPIPTTEAMYIEGKNKIEKSATKDEITVRISCVEVENGFVITKQLSGRRPTKNATAEDGKEYFDESLTYITTECPFKDEMDDIKLPDISGVLNMSASLSGKIKV